MLKIKHAGRRLRELLLLTTVGLVPVVSGLLVMIVQLEMKLAENAAVSVQEAVYSIDQALNRLHEAAQRALPFAGKPCESVKNALQDQVVSRSMVRSLTLVEGNEAYCSSSSDSLDYLSSFMLSGQQVELSYGQPDKRRKLLVNFYLEGSGKGVIVTAYATQLRNELDGFQDGLTLLLEFGDRYIWSKGDSRDAQRPSQSEFLATALSARYGYRVKGGYAQGSTAQEIRQSMLQILPSLMLVGIVTGSIVFLALFRARSNRRDSAAHVT
ncbi:MAG: CSS-motif domain-containing protein [Candidatus Pseudomonas phytovorans]|uniref:CSS-motif domain-containing protein n=1 Tax=Candidatus Pseudomonas phytovorans TaxID=3121377 RepID=A0AAJ5WF74_9PSED|nr:CSS-motif domain-containing protein [Pseudomonas sp.]WEK28679.1 MAG: CSS-motif domain-containing protein [Pseudomonas sp.]